MVLFPLLPFVVVETYLHGRVTDGASSLGPRRRVALTAVIAGLVALVVGAILAPPDPFSQARYVTYAYPFGVVVGYVTTA